jgi:hypothetical protein
MVKVTSPSTEIAWSSEERLARMRHTKGATLRSKDGGLERHDALSWLRTKGIAV